MTNSKSLKSPIYYSNSPFSYFLLLIFCLSLMACGSSKKAFSDSEINKPLKEKSPKYLLKMLNERKIEADYFAGKARITLIESEKTRKFTSIIRMVKDSAIWMNFKKTNIEAARILITPDSVYILNRIDNEYAIKDMDFIARQINLPIFNFEDNQPFQWIQNLLLGNPVFIPVKHFLAKVDSNNYVLEGKYQELQSVYKIDGRDYTLKQIQFLDNRFNQNVRFSYDDYESVENNPKFSYFRTIEADSPETGRVVFEIKLTKASINTPKKIYFEIPSHYKKIE